MPFDTFETQKLLATRPAIEQLVDLELEAFNSLDGVFKDTKGRYSIHKQADKEFATSILYSQTHFQYENNIMILLDEVLEHLRNRMEQHLKRESYHIERYTFYINILSIFVLTLIFSSIFVIRRRVFKPLKLIVKAIRRFQEDLNDSTQLTIENKDEIGLIAEQFNSMRDTIQEEIKNRESKDKKLQEYIKLIDNNLIISSTDVNGFITYVSDAFVKISGYRKSELLNKKHKIVKHPDMKDEIFKELWETISSGRTWRGEIKNRKKDGSSYWVQATIYPQFDNRGEITGYTAIRLDITEEKRIEKLLSFAEERERELQQYIDLVDENVITSSTDLDGNITYVSKALINTSGYSEDELLGKKFDLIQNSNMDKSIFNELIHHLIHNRTWRGEISNKRKDGIEYWTKVSIYQNLNKSGEAVGYTSIGIDVTDKKRIEELSIRDDLTKLYNRRYFHAEIGKLLQIIRKSNEYISLAFIDIDYFKKYNDKYGHLQGDEVLKAIGNILHEFKKQYQLIPFRFDGEGFVILHKAIETDEVLNIVKSLKERVEALKIEHETSEVSNYLTVSIGVTLKQWEEGLTEKELYREAEQLLLKAKESGRDSIKSNI